MKSYGIVLLCLLNSWVVAQSDTTELKQLINQGNQYLLANDLDSARWMVDRIYQYYGNDEAPTVSLLRVQLMDASIWERKGQPSKALQVIERAIGQFDKMSTPNLGLQAMLLTKRSIVQNRLGRYEEGLISAEAAREIALARDTTADRITISALMTLSSAHFHLYQTKRAIELIEEALSVHEKAYPEGHPSSARLLNNLANRYKDLRRYDKALYYLDQARNIQESHFGKDGSDLANTHYNIALNLQSKGSFKKAIEHYLESARITGIYVKHHPNLAEDHQKIGGCYVSLGRFQDALHHYQIAASLYEQLPEESLAEIGLWSAYAKLFAAQEADGSALDYAEKALSAAMARLGSNHPKVASYLSDVATHQTHLGHHDLALSTVTKGLKLLRYDSRHFDPKTISSKEHLYGLLSMAGYVYLTKYHHSGESPWLEKAMDYYQHALLVVDDLRAGMQEEKSKHLLSQQTIRIYEHLIETVYHLYLETGIGEYVELALQVSEMSRRSTVLEAMLSRQTGRFPGVPTEVYLKERRLHERIAELESKLGSEKKADRALTPDAERHARQQALFEARQQLWTYLDSVSVDYPRYHQHRYPTNIPNCTVWQATLEADQCLVEYFDGKDHLYVMTLTQGDLQMVKIAKNDELLGAKRQLLTHLTNTDSILSRPHHSLLQFQMAAQKLFQLLLSPALPNEMREILIIPDGFEADIPFEVLLQRQPEVEDPGEWPYLCQSHLIHYAQSILAWQEQKTWQPQARKSFAGFAPSYDHDIETEPDTLDHPTFAMVVREREMRLPGARQEVIDIQKIFGGEIFIGAEATEAQFLNTAQDYQILHLSAHSLLHNTNPDRSSLILTPSVNTRSDDALTAAEICHLQLSAELAVLSACQTGSGKTNRGEGVMSLGRAFSFAGVPATVQSLWKVPDASTSEMMPLFYSGLKAGLAKHEALNQARLTYLQTEHISEQKHPYFWAGFVLYGNADSLKSKHAPTVFLWIAVPLALVITLLYHKRFWSIFRS